jgi:hypothetical protein
MHTRRKKGEAKSIFCFRVRSEEKRKKNSFFPGTAPSGSIFMTFSTELKTQKREEELSTKHSDIKVY